MFSSRGQRGRAGSAAGDEFSHHRMSGSNCAPVMRKLVPGRVASCWLCPAPRCRLPPAAALLTCGGGEGGGR